MGSPSETMLRLLCHGHATAEATDVLENLQPPNTTSVQSAHNSGTAGLQSGLRDIPPFNGESKAQHRERS